MTEKIFVIGFHKTGTTSLKVALEVLGLRVTGPNSELLAAFRQGDTGKVRLVVDQYDAFQDEPWFMFYEDLNQQFPDAKFILSERKPRKWLRSFKKHYRNRISDTHRFLYGPVGALDAPRHCKRTYIEHNARVKAFFAGSAPGKLLVLDLEKGDGWELLCPFLNKPVPRAFLTGKVRRFPHTNVASSRQFMRRHKHLKRARRAIRTSVRSYYGPGAWDKISSLKKRLLWRLGI